MAADEFPERLGRHLGGGPAEGLLDQHPEWQAELRRLLLADDFLAFCRRPA